MSDIPLSIVVAVAKNGVIGRGNDLPWRIPSDLKRFKAVTLGKPVIMGRKTWDSLPRKPLPGRANFVVSRTAGTFEGAIVCDTPEKALQRAREAAIASGAGEVCLIGGAALYGALLPVVSRIYLTEVDLTPEGDAHFPMLNPIEWREVSAQAFDAQPGDDAGFVVRVLERV
ncbi:MAG: dihydrofolate reductase [Oceanicaulis sp.]|uniref:dihydrofolate reductase n=1 Tax=Glycocaulis sp. TaxID=1969725 RepID=UPI0025BA8378|nr:dihydrofolate reductase [Glycocaulis sp.]MCC5981960.1 dihydrofolate reductase [Oceanicaulis sp.]MCH8521205.1 dihydrofolate reductase [Glycocaulis sp.]